MDGEFKTPSSTSPSRLSPLAEPFQPLRQQPFSQSLNPSKDNSQHVAPISLIDHFPDVDLDTKSPINLVHCAAQLFEDYISAFPVDCEDYNPSEVSKFPDDSEFIRSITSGQNCTKELHSSITLTCTGENSGFGDWTAQRKQENIMDSEVSVCSKEKGDLGLVDDQTLEGRGTCVFEGLSPVGIPSDNMYIELPDTCKRDDLLGSPVKEHVKTPALNLQVESNKGKSEGFLSRTNSNREIKKNENFYYNQVSTLMLPLYNEQSLPSQGKGYEIGQLPNLKYDEDATSPDLFGNSLKKPCGPGIDTLFEDSFTMVNKNDMDESLSHVDFLRKAENVPESSSTRACTGLNPLAPLFFPKHAERSLNYNESESTQDDSLYLQKSNAAAAYSEAPELACDIEKELNALGILCSDGMDEQKKGHHLSAEMSGFSLYDLENSPLMLKGNLAPIGNVENERKHNGNRTDIMDAEVNDGATVPVRTRGFSSRKPLSVVEESSLVNNSAVSKFSRAAHGFNVNELLDEMHHLSELFVEKCPDTFCFTEPLLIKIQEIINNLAICMKNGDRPKASLYEPLSNPLSFFDRSASTCERILSSKESEEDDQVFDGFSGSPTSTLDSNIQIGPRVKGQIDAGYVSLPKLNVKVELYEGKGKDSTSAKCSNSRTFSGGTNKKLFPYNPTVLVVEESNDESTMQKTKSLPGARESIMALPSHLEESPILHGKEVKIHQHEINVKTDPLTIGNYDTCHNSNVDINTDLRGADVMNAVGDSFIMVEKNDIEENDIDVDSPCWKGLKNIVKDPSRALGQSDHEPPKKLPEVRNNLNPEAPLFFPCYGDRSSNYEDSESVGDPSLPLSAVSAATVWSKEPAVLSNGDNRLCCSEAHYLAGVQLSNDKPCNDHPLIDNKSCLLSSPKVVCPLLKEDESGSEPKIKIQTKANLEGRDKDIISAKFNRASSVTFHGSNDILGGSLFAYGSLTRTESPSDKGGWTKLFKVHEGNVDPFKQAC